MSTGADNKTQAITPEYAEGYERIFGDRKPSRGRWVYDEAQQKLVRAEDYRAPEVALNAPILSGRFYEGSVAQDGTDIGSRAKHREYMHSNGLTMTGDYTQTWAQAEKERTAIRNGETGRGTKERRQDLASALQKLRKP